MARRKSLAFASDQRVYSRCKGFHHRWDDFTPIDMAPPSERGIERISFRCTECQRQKHYLYQPSTGWIGAPRYTNAPEDYSSVTMLRWEWKMAYIQEYATSRRNGS